MWVLREISPYAWDAIPIQVQLVLFFVFFEVDKDSKSNNYYDY